MAYQITFTKRFEKHFPVLPKAPILKMDGCGSDYVMKSVCRHSMMEKEENAKRGAAKKLQKALFS